MQAKNQNQQFRKQQPETTYMQPPPPGYYPPPPPPPQYPYGGYYDQGYYAHPPPTHTFQPNPYQQHQENQEEKQYPEEVPQDYQVQRPQGGQQKDPKNQRIPHEQYLQDGQNQQPQYPQTQYPTQQQQQQQQLENPQETEENIENLRNELNQEIEKLLYYLEDPKASKQLHQILRETCDRLKKTITMDYQPSPNDKTSHTCFIFINNELYGQGTGKSKKEARNESAREASLRLLNMNQEALRLFRQETEKEIDKRAQLGIVSQQYPEQNPPPAPAYGHKYPAQQILPNDDMDPTLIQEYRQENLPNYDGNKNYREDLNEYAHKYLRKPIKYDQFQQGNEWVSICQVSNLSEKGVGINQKVAKNIAAYRLLLRARDLEQQEPGILGGGDEAEQKRKEKKMQKLQKLKDKKQQKKGNLPEEAGEEENEVYVQKKIKIEQEMYSNTTNQQVNNNNNYEQLDTRFIDFSKFDNPFEEKELQLQSHLQDLVKNLLPKNQDLVNSQILVKELMEHELDLRKLDIVSIIPVGSYSYKTLSPQKMVIDLVANYSLQHMENGNNENNNINDEDRFKEHSKILKEFLDSTLKRPFQDELIARVQAQDDYFKTNERVFLDNNSKCINIHSLENPQIKINLYFHFLNDNKYNNAILNRIWMNKFKNLEEYQYLQSLMRIVRFFRQKHAINLPAEILDFVLYTVTDKFRSASLVKGVIQFFQFIGRGGLQEIVENENKNLVEITQFQLDNLKKAFSTQNRVQIDKLQQICQDTIQKGNYQEVLQL